MASTSSIRSPHCPHRAAASAASLSFFIYMAHSIAHVFSRLCFSVRTRSELFSCVVVSYRIRCVCVRVLLFTFHVCLCVVCLARRAFYKTCSAASCMRRARAHVRPVLEISLWVYGTPQAALLCFRCSYYPSAYIMRNFKICVALSRYSLYNFIIDPARRALLLSLMMPARRPLLYCLL